MRWLFHTRARIQESESSFDACIKQSDACVQCDCAVELPRDDEIEMFNLESFLPIFVHWSSLRTKSRLSLCKPFSRTDRQLKSY